MPRPRVCPWTGESFTPKQEHQRFSSPAAKKAWHAAARDLGETMALLLEPGQLRRFRFEPERARARGPQTEAREVENG